MYIRIQSFDNNNVFVTSDSNSPVSVASDFKITNNSLSVAMGLRCMVYLRCSLLARAPPAADEDELAADAGPWLLCVEAAGVAGAAASSRNCRLGLPSSHWFTCAANLNEHSDSK